MLTKHQKHDSTTMNRGRSLISAHTNTSVELFNNSLTRNRLRGAIAQKQLTIQSEKNPGKKW